MYFGKYVLELSNQSRLDYCSSGFHIILYARQKYGKHPKTILEPCFVKNCLQEICFMTYIYISHI